MTNPSPPPAAAGHPLADALYRDGFVGLKDALPGEWADQMLADFEVLYAEAERQDLASRQGGGRGRIPRGPGEDPRRYYFAVHPERLSGFQDLVTHPVLDELCSNVLGDDYQLVEVGFDVALPGAVRQPLHRDFPIPEETKATGRLSSLAVNATCVDVTPEMGPLEIAPGSHFDDDSEFEKAMRVPPTMYERYLGRLERRMASRGDVSVRTGLTIHRGTQNTSARPRPVMILGVMGAGFETFAHHDFSMTRDYYDRLPDGLKAHLRRCTVSDRLHPVVQDYVLDFLLEEG